MNYPLLLIPRFCTRSLLLGAAKLLLWVAGALAVILGAQWVVRLLFATAVEVGIVC